jgi:putative PLP-dependent aminotransferase (TIGR04422 family)
MSASYFLWPVPRRPSLLGAMLSSSSAREIEDGLNRKFPTADAVLFSSARAGFTAILQALRLGRSDLVWCPAFSSRCVWEAAAQVATPTPIADPAVKAVLVYHQWGFVHSHAWDADVPVIEDSVDSLLLPGANVFPAGGRFALWSLPKVLATAFGGIVFCRHIEDAATLRHIRDERGVSRLQACLRLASASNARASVYWNGAESVQGGLPGFALAQILTAVRRLEATIHERLEVLASLSPRLAELTRASGRIPSNLPLSPTSEISRRWTMGGEFTAGLRHFNVTLRVPAGSWCRVAPLPLHIDVTSRALAAWSGQLFKEGVSDAIGVL